MKRIKIKYRELYSIANVYKAIRRYNKNRPANRKVAEDDITKIAIAIIKKLKNLDTINFAKYRKKTLPRTPSSPKERHLLIPTKENLLIQACLIEALEKEIDKKIPMNSYSSRKNRGTHKIVVNIRKFLKKISPKRKLYCLYFDVHKFYDNINHDILFDKIKLLFKDKDIIELFRKIIYSTPGDKGIPIGNACSHILANIYQAKILDYVNNSKYSKFAALYMDNWVILSTNKKHLHKLKYKLLTMFDEHKLSLNKDMTIFQVNNHRGIKIGGFSVFRCSKTYCYKNTWRRILRTLKIIRTVNYTPHDARSFLSRLGTFKYIRQTIKLTKNLSLKFLKWFSTADSTK